MSKYDPQSYTDRTVLGSALVAKMDECGFTEEKIPGTKERVFSREVPGTDGKIRVAVYTTVVGGECRSVGRDSIKVCLLYTTKDGSVRGVGKSETRTHRVGELDAITTRVHLKMRAVYKTSKNCEKCSACGAPKFKSKKKNMVCAELCWLGGGTARNSRFTNSTGTRRNSRRAYHKMYSVNPLR